MICELISQTENFGLEKFQKSFDIALLNIIDELEKTFEPLQWDDGSDSLGMRELSCNDLSLADWLVKIPKVREENWVKWVDTTVDEQCYYLFYGLEFLSKPYRNMRPVFQSLVFKVFGVEFIYVLDTIYNEGLYYFKEPFVLRPQSNIGVTFNISTSLEFLGEELLFPMILKAKVFGKRSRMIYIPSVIPSDLVVFEQKKGFFCQDCQVSFPAIKSSYQCISCHRKICADCYEKMSEVGLTLCPNCKGKVIEV